MGILGRQTKIEARHQNLRSHAHAKSWARLERTH
jgi:hypothetical protein